MFTVRRFYLVVFKLAFLIGVAGLTDTGFGQSPSSSVNGSNTARATGRPVTIPLTIKINSRQYESDDELQNIDLTVSEDGEPQTILSIRGSGTNSPITLAVLIQEDLVSSVGNETKSMAEFVRGLPKGSRVMIGYLRTGSLQVKQKFTNDLEKAARALRPPSGFAGTGPFNPYVEVIEALKKFDSQPLGRRAILLVSDGLDISRGVDSSGPTQSIDLQRAINEAQRRSVAIYGFYAPTAAASSNTTLAANAQSSLLRISNETGGNAYFQGTGVPVSFDPFIRELDVSLEKQVALTFLSTHMNKGFHRIEVKSVTPGVRVAFPNGYVR
jgi:VWFA-related protein